MWNEQPRKECLFCVLLHVLLTNFQYRAKSFTDENDVDNDDGTPVVQDVDKIARSDDCLAKCLLLKQPKRRQLKMLWKATMCL